MTLLFLPLPGNETLAATLATALEGRVVRSTLRSFPDGETYLRLDESVEGARVVLVCSLDRPDERTVPMLLAAETVRDLGAESVGLVTPYLAYMRQDARFHAGEGITSHYFARWLSRTLDWLVTVDPHLHRIDSLERIYDIPTRTLHAAPAIAAWVAANVDAPLLVGPDAESEQWVAEVAAYAGVPHVVFAKTRHGDHDVEITAPDLSAYTDRTPVLVDDIVSSAGTMIEAATLLANSGFKAPLCVAIHGVFAGDAYERLVAAGVSRVATCNTVPHPSNAIDVTELIGAGLREFLGGGTSGS